MPLNLTTIILTLNEEKNLQGALDSIRNLGTDIFVLDSLSTDRTIAIAEAQGCRVFQRPFDNYGSQRNHALTQLPIRTEWVLFLDADERLLPELKEEISQVLSSPTEFDGFYLKWRLIWMGRWIRRGYYPTWLIRLFRLSKARCESRDVGEHIVIDGKVGRLRNDFVNDSANGIDAWIQKHLKYADAEANFVLGRGQGQELIAGSPFGDSRARMRWLKQRVWFRLPLVFRPSLYFFFRYFVRGGFLDGREGFIYHFFQAWWFQVLIAAKVLERAPREK